MNEENNPQEEQESIDLMAMVCWFCEDTIDREEPVNYVSYTEDGETYPVAVCPACFKGRS